MRKSKTKKQLIKKLLDGYQDDPIAEKNNLINEKQLNKTINQIAGSGIKNKVIDTTVLIKRSKKNDNII
jgi:hypothetical protein